MLAIMKVLPCSFSSSRLIAPRRGARNIDRVRRFSVFNSSEVTTAAVRKNSYFPLNRMKTMTRATKRATTKNGRRGNLKMPPLTLSLFSFSTSSLLLNTTDGDINSKSSFLLQESMRGRNMDVRVLASGSGGGGSGDGNKKKKKKKAKVNKKKGAKKEDDDSDIVWEEEEEEEEEIEDEDINVVYANYNEKDVQGGNIDTASTPWGELALECVRAVLADEKNMDEFEGKLKLFAFKAIPSTKRIMISVDDLDDQYGSPNLDDLIAVSRKLNELAESKGFPDDVAIEVASPGAERKLTIPEDLSRFRELKMKVVYKDNENDNLENETMILNVEDFEEENGLVVFRLADVQENRPPKKGMPMSKKKKEWRKKVKYADIASVNLYIDTAN